MRAIFKDGLELFLYTGEEFAGEETDQSTKPPLPYRDGGWQFDVTGTGFEASLQIELDWVPKDGHPVPWSRAARPRRPCRCSAKPVGQTTWLATVRDMV